MPRLQHTDSVVRYLVRIGMDYRGADGSFIRREPGEVADDIPANDVEWLLAQQAIESVEKEVIERGD